MKKIIVLFLMLLFVSGCNEEQRKAERIALEQRFQAAYPDNWQQKLLEYDLELPKMKERERQEFWQRFSAACQKTSDNLGKIGNQQNNNVTNVRIVTDQNPGGYGVKQE